ncbi:ABC-2 type transport system permease protein [Paenibacillaceae bacterium GAS479]|nr:ABC-2 type transport system permease protein [Paenibacillaceae bacterium GAS479]
MTFSTKRVTAIFVKDFKDMSRNMFVSSTLILPLLMAIIYRQTGTLSIDMTYLIINMTFSFVGAFIQSSLIAEEKEKNTLRGLMLSPASTLEIFFGKSLLSLIVTLVLTAGSILLLGYSPANVPVISVALVLSAVFYVGLGTLIGLITKSVMEASVAILPAVGVFTFGSLLTLLFDKYPFLKVAEYLPNLQLIELASAVERGESWGEGWPNLLVIFAWIVVVYLVTTYVYRKRRMDD